MALRKISKDEKEILKTEIKRLNELSDRVINEDIRGYNYDWIGIHNDLFKISARVKIMLDREDERVKQANCSHDPFERDIDWNENQYCTLCGKITKTAEELYPDEEEIF